MGNGACVLLGTFTGLKSGSYEAATPIDLSESLSSYKYVYIDTVTNFIQNPTAMIPVKLLTDSAEDYSVALVSYWATYTVSISIKIGLTKAILHTYTTGGSANWNISAIRIWGVK